MNSKDLYIKCITDNQTEMYYLDKDFKIPYTGHVEDYYNGKLDRECDILDGYEYGIAKEYYDTGELELAYEVRWGICNGLGVEYYKNGKIRSIEIWYMNDITDAYSYNEEGKMVEEEHMDEHSFNYILFKDELPKIRRKYDLEKMNEEILEYGKPIKYGKPIYMDYMDMADKMLYYMETRNRNIIITGNISISEPDLLVIVVKILSWLKLGYEDVIGMAEGKDAHYKPLQINTKYPWCNDLCKLVEKEKLFHDYFSVADGKFDFANSVNETDRMTAREKAYYNYNPPSGNRQQLKYFLKENGVPSFLYNLGEKKHTKDGALVLEFVDNEWYVYTYDSGRKIILQIFEIEDEACQYIYERLKKYLNYSFSIKKVFKNIKQKMFQRLYMCMPMTVTERLYYKYLE